MTDEDARRVEPPGGAPGDEGEDAPTPQVERDPETGAEAAADRGHDTGEPPD
jgi:hypothetical protein